MKLMLGCLVSLIFVSICGCASARSNKYILSLESNYKKIDFKEEGLYPTFSLNISNKISSKVDAEKAFNLFFEKNKWSDNSKSLFSKIKASKHFYYIESDNLLVYARKKDYWVRYMILEY